jgi:hypothetical protein
MRLGPSQHEPELSHREHALDDLDLIDHLRREPDEPRALQHLIANASMLVIGDARVSVASLADIIRSKEISDRPKERVALPELQRLGRLPDDA